MAAYILVMDDLNLQTLHYQLACLTKQNSGNKAVFLYDKFYQNYANVHSKTFKYDLKQFLKIDVDGLWE